MIPNADRFKRAVLAFVRELFPTLDYMGLYEYVVVGQNLVSQTWDLQVASDIGLPQFLPKVPLRTTGTFYDLDNGTTVLVGFENHDPTRPFIAYLDKYSGTKPNFIGLSNATPIDVPPIGAGVARVGDAAGPFLITSGSTNVFAR